MTAWTIPAHRSRGLLPSRDRGMRRFWLRALLAPGVAWEWSRKAEKLYNDHGGDIHRSRVLSKPLHGYLRRRLRPAARLRFLLDHHRAIASLIEREAISTLWRGEALELVILPGRKDLRFRLYLANAIMEQTHREGELAIVREGEPTPLSRLTFNLVSLEGRLALAVGGLQGPSEGKRMVIDATRILYGLRPKDATLLAARAPRRKPGPRRQRCAACPRHASQRSQNLQLRRLLARTRRAPLPDFRVRLSSTRRSCRRALGPRRLSHDI